jgi:hypothetical protein|tara:strand:- start:31 stop:2475 length:2445 start_codon:yes stop_codon:yes gene_type:complete
MSQVGRIGGGVLKSNLERQGIDLAFENDLLYLDVNNDRIGINTTSMASPDVLTTISPIRTTNAITTGTFNLGSFELQGNAITQLVENTINLNSTGDIFATGIETENLKFDANELSSTTDNTNIELRPNGTGTIEIQSSWNSTGSIHSTGNITFAGDLTLGDDNNDNVTFAADVNSDILPNSSNANALGSQTKRWNAIYSNLLNGTSTFVDNVIVESTALSRRQGNIFYVSTLGSNTNVGDHQHGAFRTLSHALSVVDASTQGPVTIHVYPGEYEEIFPLVVPERVTISGEDIRNCIIKPTAGTNTNNAFEMNQNVTIENLTIKDFYSPGHAFTFAANTIITDRSPYIRNITVITKGSVVSANDPRGFDQGDAGKGALIDGASTGSSTREASMLFHSATFITPGVDCITMTNGVRVEWLNSFTYFANRGLYATNGTAGKANDGTTFGAEIRSIGSANVYGTKGAEADGANTLMYLIGHNFAYIGVGKDVSNDRTLTVTANEVTELNSGNIYYTTTDADGTFKVGDNFFVDFETGSTSIDASTIDFSGIGSITVRNGLERSFIDGSKVDVGNIRINGNTITTIDGDLTLSPVTGLFNTDNNVSLILSNGTDIQRNNLQADIRYNTDSNLYEGYSSGNLSLGGIYSSDRQESIDTHDTNNTIILRAAGAQVGSIDSNSTNLHGLSTGDILFDNNLVTTTLSQSDLELKRTTATNVVDVYDFDLKNSTFYNTSANNLTLSTTNNGYVKFGGSTGLVIPVGTEAQQNPSPIEGETRYNTDQEYLETWNGEEWQRSAGEGAEVTDVVLKELVDIYAIVLG